ncbi:hypothetical protein KVT40_001843 [Elsinoe batatas]|uniref:Uncharacterized protein n=1 Tax=Elsinoe batatas TaxID=2601811 RepID=A0A8K0PLQ8_9PEZI|nr:hypothetical protein KVT40_001843 [Elsinoe batatas]
MPGESKKLADAPIASDPSLQWLYKTRGKRLHVFPSTSRVPTLMNLCARTLIRNLPLIQEEHIDALPPHIPAAIYSALCSSSLLPLRATQLFAPLSPSPRPHPIRLRLAHHATTTLKDRLTLLEQNQSRLLHFLANLHSPSSRWVVSIHLTGLLPWTSLMQLGLMENLRVL